MGVKVCFPLLNAVVLFGSVRELKVRRKSPNDFRHVGRIHPLNDSPQIPSVG
jgi:hypothetical protein